MVEKRQKGWQAKHNQGLKQSRDLDAFLFYSILLFLIKTKQGFVGVPGDARWFFQHVHMVVPLEARAFYQVIRPELPCAWYFDVDGSDPTFNMVTFLDAMFEEMAKELGNCGFEIISETIWTTTLLTDASSNVAGNKRKASCHGTCPNGNIVFSDNHTTMKEFAHRLLYRLETRSDNASLRVLDKKTGTMVIPLDVSVYGKHRCFRTTGSSKMSGDAAECRPLTLASYNRYPLESNDDDEALYLLSLISQKHPVTVHVVNSHASNKKGKGIKRERRPSTVAAAPSSSSSSSSVISSSPALESFLLSQARAWGNPGASVSTVAPQNNSPNAGLYVAFSNATAASDHKHDSNNIYALVDLTSLTIHWRCHQGSQKLCKTHFSQELPMDIALSITSTKKQK